MKLRFLLFLALASIALILVSCDTGFDIDQFKTLDSNANIGGDTVYIQLNPAWEGFNNPQDLIVGREPFIYVADTDNDRIVMMNLDGQVLGSRSVKRPVAIAQDFRFNLIVCAELDTTVNGVTQSYSAVFKYDLFAANHRIENAPVQMLLPRSNDFNFPQRKYTAVTVFYDNSFYIGRTGPNNSNMVDPDNSLLQFKVKKLANGTLKDTLIGRVAGLDPTGSGLRAVNQVSSLTSLGKRNYDIIATMTGPNNFKAQWMQYIQSVEFTGYVNVLMPGATQMMVPARFDRPEGSAVDNAGNMFIADAGKDSVFKYNTFGDELQSFGGPAVFDEPSAVAYFDKTLYVADKKNNRIVRFVLSTDIR